MLGWLRSKPTCPVGNDEKEWIERRFAWLITELGFDRLHNGTLVLPTTEFFPANYEATEEELNDLMQRVAKHMDVDPARLQLEFYEDSHPKFSGKWNDGTAEMYSEVDGCFTIWLEAATLADPLAVVATLAHEIGHVVLLGQRRVSPEEPDHELLTDLLTVFLGMGILTSNSVIHENYWHAGNFHGWSIGRSGYLTMEMYGYALALYSIARNDLSPSWIGHLRPDVRAACKKGIRYVTETGDCATSFTDQMGAC